MPKLVVANVPEEMLGDLSEISPDKRKAFGQGAQRMLWHAGDGDVLVLPRRPDPVFLEYVTELTGSRAATLHVVVPPPGELGSDLVTADRLADAAFRDELRTLLARRPVDEIVCTYSDLAVTGLATALDIEYALPGHAFSAQGGDALANSKTVFRAVAAGNGVPIAPGLITDRPEHAESEIGSLLEAGHDVMVKQQFSGGGLGNEILTRTEVARPSGAANVVVLADAGAVHAYVTERWSWLTQYKGHSLVVERYFDGSSTVYAEFLATDEGCELRGTGEILMEPVATGEVIPPQSVTPETISELVETGRRASEAFRVMGYRGTICADAIRTPDGEVLFTETNGRLTASSHLHLNLIGRVVGEAYRDRRVFLERSGRWAVPSLTEALTRLEDAGLDYDPVTKLGVVVTADYTPAIGRVTYCVVAHDLDSAHGCEEKIAALLSGPRR